MELGFILSRIITLFIISAKFSMRGDYPAFVNP